MKPLTIWLKEQDLTALRGLAITLELPPHTLARSLLVRELKTQLDREVGGQQ